MEEDFEDKAWDGGEAIDDEVRFVYSLKHCFYLRCSVGRW